MANFLKGIVIGLGGIAPGLSGSVLLVIFGLYHKTVEAISTIFKNFKKNLLFLIPLFAGMGVGVVLFSKLVDFLLANYEMYTRYAFLGLIVGTIPLFYKEVRKQGFANRYYIAIAAAFAAGLAIFYLNGDMFPPVENPNLLQSMVLGLAVAGSSIIPGVDSAAILSALGLYELYVSSVASLNFAILIPAGVGLGVGVLLFSFIINKLIQKCYTLTFSIIFGLFLSIIPSVLNESCHLGMNVQTLLAMAFLALGFGASLLFGNLEKFKEKVQK